ncbi:MAG: GNAT family N-acetyltransferase [Eubacteriales bacterium]|nr:GNAT family N-acetyltransferase [Eubacteriales bacterium]
MSWTIRQATPEDAEPICHITQNALGYECSPELARRRIAEIVQKDTERIFIAVREDGFIGGYLQAADYGTVYTENQKNILALAVDESCRGLGLGRMLLKAVESWAQACGCEAVRLVSSFPRANAHQFYLHCGYSLRKEQKNFIKHFA